MTLIKQLQASIIVFVGVWALEVVLAATCLRLIVPVSHFTVSEHLGFLN